MSDVLKQPKRVMAQAIEQAALNGVARAIESRKAAGVELSAGDVDQVSGGAMLNWQIAGGDLLGVLKAVQTPVEAKLSVSSAARRRRRKWRISPSRSRSPKSFSLWRGL